MESIKIIIEELKSKRAKDLYRQLVKKYHTDVGYEGDDIIKKINNAKDAGDKSLFKLYKELLKKEDSVDKALEAFKKRTGMSQEEWKEKVHSMIKRKRKKKQEKARKRK